MLFSNYHGNYPKSNRIPLHTQCRKRKPLSCGCRI